ncbi:MAG: prepilin-type N-terminal cleavage/methylation domain-containing protein [Candidatus Moraniibacteriota bacterium]|nr:MAG: prepilin-type N-terminal cleavage/methylation domain-containing protein [Candidatus Moranbacteria bacterium]
MTKPVLVLRGMTLLEVVVAIAIAFIAMEGFTLLFLKTWDTNKFIIEEGLASAAASRATNKIVIQLRGVQQADNGDYPLESADDFDLEFYADVDDDGVVEKVHYYLDQVNDQLKFGVSNPLATNPVTYPSGDSEVTTVTSFVVNESDNPIFYYYNDDYPGDTTNNPLNTPASVGNIQMVRVKLLINIDPVHAPNNVNIESFVDLRNLHDYE